MTIPYVKGKTITAVYGLPMEAATKAELRKLRADHKVDVNSWIRGMISAELPKLKRKVGA